MTMRKNLLASLVMVAISGATAAHAERKIVSVDYGIEASTDTLLLPSSSDGSVVLTCASCASRSYRLTDHTTYLIGKNAVTFGALGAFIRAGGIRTLTLFVKLNEPVVTRIIVADESRPQTGK